MNKVAIIGYGWVGKAMYELFPDAVVYDPHIVDSSMKLPVFGATKEEVNKCDIAFICVPTPNQSEDMDNPPHEMNYRTFKGEGALDTSIVEEAISWCECPLIVIRSTINPGDCDKWENKYPNKDIIFQPEYLGETVAHPLLDPKTRPFLIIGGGENGDLTRPLLIDLYMTVYNANTSITQLTNLEAEVVKLSENRAIACKVAQCQELFDVCRLAGINYTKIQQAVYKDDPRFNLWFTAVYPDKRGMNSKCIPKDVYAWCAWAESLGYEPKITRVLLEKNKEWVVGN